MGQDCSDLAEKVSARLQSGGRLTVLTGAGISAESGVATFRDLGGLWEQYRVEDLASPEGFARNPGVVYDFYNMRRAQLKRIEPNPGHRALAALERQLGAGFTLVTQNVDDLHERAGSQRVLHMHGELRKASCQACGAIQVWPGDLDALSHCGQCKAQSLRPHIVWFGEMPLYMEEQIPASLDAEIFMSIGTSGQVYPAAGFVGLARANGALTLEINLMTAEHSQQFQHSIYGKAGEVLPRLLAEITALL